MPAAPPPPTLLGLVLASLAAAALLYPVPVADAARGSAQSTVAEVTLPPRFLSRGQTFRVVAGDTLVLPCEVEDLGSYVLLWRRGAAVLTAASLMVTRDGRFRLVDGYNLEIRGVRPTDAGDYVCQVSEADGRDQIHTVEILVPPSIRVSPGGGRLQARKGASVTLECKAAGNPVPAVVWTRADAALPSGEPALEGFSLTLERVDRHQAGLYRCTASNGVGSPAHLDVRLDVLYAPEIEVERSWVHSGEGYEAQLVCIVHGQPPPELMWYKDELAVEPSPRRLVESRGSRHALTVRDVQGADFGNYSCVADNSLGRAKKHMELSGRPGPAEFLSAPFSPAADSYNLTWVVESYPPLEEVRLLYRRLLVNDSHMAFPGSWHDVILTPRNTDTFTHVMSYTIRGLPRASMFEAIVQAKNRYGWNEVSDMFQFYTRGAGEYDSEPEMAERELSAANLSNSAAAAGPRRAAAAAAAALAAALAAAVALAQALALAP
ncbi:hypothetical protein R5R35_014242 [Gryllus longicercus]|uniref:Ig-like domain-containing protein n=1 Tax=Gryllus longicercus TaxID=2509291 RepID=A0AAN9ZFB4_9ORTH